MKLHYHPSTASMIVHLLIEEMGLPCDYVRVDRESGAHKTPEYLRLNPNGLFPVLEDGDLVLYETAAICLHLCDTHPDKGLLPPLASAERAQAYKWLVWMSNTLQPTLSVYFYPERWVPEGEAALALREQARHKCQGLLDQLDAELARHGGPWLAGAGFSVLDPYAFTLCRWTRNFSAGAARERPHLGAFLQRMLLRPALQRAFAREGIAPPYV